MSLCHSCDRCIASGLTAETDVQDDDEEGDDNNGDGHPNKPADCYCHQIEKLQFKVNAYDNRFLSTFQSINHLINQFFGFFAFFSLGHAQDSYLFLSGSLSRLTDALRTNVKPFDCTDCRQLGMECASCVTKRPVETVFPYTCKFVTERYGREHLPMLLGKQTYCYSYIDAYEKLEETEFPGIDKFYNKLYERHITAEEYSHAHRVYTELKLATLGDYAALYLVRFFFFTKIVCSIGKSVGH